MNSHLLALYARHGIAPTEANADALKAAMAKEKTTARAALVAPLTVDAVLVKAAALTDQLVVDDFSGLRADAWPATTIPALNLAAAAYERDAATGLAVSLELRAALFELGQDVGDPNVLARIAGAHDLPAPSVATSDAVQADYDGGVARGVKGSPHFFVASDDFFCPALDLGHDAEGHLTARFDADMLADFFARIDA